MWQLSVIGNFLWPAWNWWATNVYDFHHFEFLFENLTAVRTACPSSSPHSSRLYTMHLATLRPLITPHSSRL